LVHSDACEPIWTSAKHALSHSVCVYFTLQCTEGRPKPHYVHTVRSAAAADQIRSVAESAARTRTHIGKRITMQPIQTRVTQACVGATNLSRSSLNSCCADLVCAKVLSLAAGLTSLLSFQLLKHSAEHYRGLLLL